MGVVGRLGWLGPLAVGACVLTLRMARPWTGSYDANGARYSTAARNYLRYGLVATRGGQVLLAGEFRPEDIHFYAHHPPGISLAIAASFGAFGAHEWSARLVPVVFTLGATALMWVVGRQLGGPLVGCLAALVFVAQPMVAFYGRMPDHEAPAGFFALAIAACYGAWERDARRLWLGLGAAAAFVGVWFAWVVAVVPWLLVGHHWLTRPRGWGWALVPAAAATVAVASVLGHVALLQGGLGELWRALTLRVGSQAADVGAGAFGLGEFLARQGSYLWTGFSAVSACLALAWVGGTGSRARADALLVAALAIFGILHVVVFKQGAYVHIYYQFYLALPLALMAALALSELFRRRRRRWAVLALGLIAAIGVEAGLKLARLHEATFYTDQLEMARQMRERTDPADRVLLVGGEASDFCQLRWYADRNIRVARTRAEGEQLWREGGFTKAFRVVRAGSGALEELPKPPC